MRRTIVYAVLILCGAALLWDAAEAKADRIEDLERRLAIVEAELQEVRDIAEEARDALITRRSAPPLASRGG